MQAFQQTATHAAMPLDGSASGSSSSSSVAVRIALEPYPLQLRTAFGTSHSSSLQRTNALLTVRIEKVRDADRCTGRGKKEDKQIGA
jgi:hypothetical protein